MISQASTFFCRERDSVVGSKSAVLDLEMAWLSFFYSTRETHFKPRCGLPKVITLSATSCKASRLAMVPAATIYSAQSFAILSKGEFYDET